MKKLIYVLIIAAILAVATVVGVMAQPQPKKMTKTTHVYVERDGTPLLLDHYISPVEGIRPCVIFVFGGGFAGGVRDDARYLPYFKMLTANGYDAVSIDYRLGLKASGAEYQKTSLRDAITLLRNAVNVAVEDTLTATRYIIDHAEEWQIDTSRIVVSGSSAGAISSLQAEYAICNHASMTEILPQGFNYAGVISFAGAIFSVKGKPEWQSAPCPIMFFHGNADCNVPYNKASVLGVGFYGSDFIVGQLKKMNSPYFFHAAEYRDHELAILPMIENHAEILQFLDGFVSNKEQKQIVEHVTSPNYPKVRTSFSVKEYLAKNYSQGE